MGNEIRTLPLAELVEDMDIYPRHAVDSVHVQSLVMALEAGTTLPPIVADRKSKRITDGWHRARAYKRLLGPTATVDVELVAYKDEAAMKFDALSRNAAHGRPLDAMDRARSVLMLRVSGFSDAQIAGALNIPERRVEKLVVRVANAPKSAGQNVPGTTIITLKRCVQHLSGQSLTRAQAEAHAKLPGTSFLLPAQQLTIALREGMVDLEDARLVAQLRELAAMLREKLPKA